MDMEGNSTILIRISHMKGSWKGCTRFSQFINYISIYFIDPDSQEFISLINNQYLVDCALQSSNLTVNSKKIIRNVPIGRNYCRLRLSVCSRSNFGA